MNKPNEFDNVTVGGDFIPVELGGHHMIIKGVEERKSSTGRNMVVVAFDFAKNDSQPGYFAEAFKSDTRPEKKWPHNGTKYILTEDSDGKCSKSFKSFVKAFEESNGCEAIWGEKFAAQFKNKKIGGVFGEQENEYNGKTSMRHELFWFCNDAKADSATIPNARYLDKAVAPAPSNNDFMAIPEGVEEEIPF